MDTYESQVISAYRNQRSQCRLISIDTDPFDSTLTAASSVVVALATPAAAFVFIRSLATSMAAGVTAVTNEICKWAGFCP